MTLGFVKFSLKPYLMRIEQEINRKIFRTAARFGEFNLNATLRGDAASEASYFREAIGGSQGPGWMTPNEVRRQKNLPPMDGGDALYDPNKSQAPQTEGESNAA